MKTIKFSFMILLIFLMTSVSVFASDDVDIEYLLNSALELFPSENYNTDDYVTRGELAYIGCQLGEIGVADFSEEGEVFYGDVPANHEYAPYINALSRVGLIKGFSDGKFEPDYTVTRADAAYTFVNILGYRIKAENDGGYPSGYNKVASSLGLFKGSSSSNHISRKEMNKVIYNVLTAPRIVMEMKDGKYVYTIDNDSTLLKDVFETSEVKGIITSNSVTALSGKIVPKNSVVIGGVQYTADDEIEDMLGYNVTAFVRGSYDSEKKIIAAAPKNMSTVRIADGDINEKSTVTEIVADLNGREKTYKIDSNVDYIYNGKLAQNLKKTDLLTKSGYIDLVDNDDDGKYEIIKVTSFEACFVYTVSAKNEKIVDKYGNSVDLSGKRYKIIINGSEGSLEDIQKLDCVNYTRTKDNDDYVVYVTRGELISGIITSVSEDSSVIIDGVSEYEISDSFLKLVSAGKAKALAINMEATYYIDNRGRIMAYENIDTSLRAEKYAYLIKISGDFEYDGVYAKMLMSDGTIQTLPVADRITVDKKSYKHDNSFIDDISTDGWVRQVVRYKLNDNDMLSMLDTPYMNTAGGEVEDTNLTEAFVDETSQGTWSNASDGILDGRFFFDSSTIVFQVPGEDYKNDYTMYRVADRSIFTNGGTYYGIKGYDLTSEYTASVILNENSSSGSIERSSPATMVKGICTVYDESSETVATGIITQDNETLIVGDKVDASKLSKGDVIRYAFDAKGRVSAISVVADASQPILETYTTGSEGANSYWTFRGEDRYGVLYLIEVNGNSFIAAELPSSDNPNEIYEFTRNGVTYPIKQFENIPSRKALFAYRFTRSTVYVYDRESNTVTESDMTALNDALYKDNPNARLVFVQCYGGINKLYVIK